jgi:transposase-like protein
MRRKLINTFHTYSYEMKKEAVQLYLSSQSRKQIVEQFDIKNLRLLNVWYVKYKRRDGKEYPIDVTNEKIRKRSHHSQ